MLKTNTHFKVNDKLYTLILILKHHFQFFTL